MIEESGSGVIEVVSVARCSFEKDGHDGRDQAQRPGDLVR